MFWSVRRTQLDRTNVLEQHVDMFQVGAARPSMEHQLRMPDAVLPHPEPTIKHDGVHASTITSLVALAPTAARPRLAATRTATGRASKPPTSPRILANPVSPQLSKRRSQAHADDMILGTSTNRAEPPAHKTEPQDTRPVSSNMSGGTSAHDQPTRLLRPDSVDR